MLKKLFVLLLLVLIVYSGIQLATSYYHYYAFKSDVEELVRTNINTTPYEMKVYVMRIANSYNIPLEEEDVNITHRQKYRVEAYWEESVNFFGIYEKTLEFFIDTSS